MAATQQPAKPLADCFEVDDLVVLDDRLLEVVGVEFAHLELIDASTDVGTLQAPLRLNSAVVRTKLASGELRTVLRAADRAS